MESKDLVGRTLGTCKLERLIGRGGMGAVFLASQTRPSRSVAVKVLFPHRYTDQAEYNAFLARFQREADVVAKLEHINIMPIYEYGEQDGFAFLVMPYLAGGSLRERLLRTGPLSPAETTLYLDQAAAALDYAHSKGVVHRDIKPSNFLFHNDGRLVLADFGIARMMQTTNSASMPTLSTGSTMLGTPEYMAPEMARGEAIDHRADIYEVGILLFQMLSGQSPFKGENPLVIAVKHIQESLPSLHKMNPAIPASVDAVVQRATAKRREDRYPSVGILAREFYIAITPALFQKPDNALFTPNYVSSEGNAPSATGREYIPTQIIGSSYAQPTQNAQRSRFPESAPPYTPPLAQPITPQNVPYSTPVPQTTRRNRLPVILVAILLLVLLSGGVIVGLQLKGAFATNTSNQPTPTPNLTQPSPTATSSQQARAAVQQYYTDINNTDYQSAYNLWSTDYRSSHAYSNFANGFSNTVHDDINIQSVTPFSDGTVQVAITLHATETSGSHVFQGYYIVGQENATWKLLRASFQQVS